MTLEMDQIPGRERGERREKMWKFSLWEEDDFEGPSSPRPKKQRTTRTQHHQEQEMEAEEEEEEEVEEEEEEEGVQLAHEEELESEHEREGGGEEDEAEEDDTSDRGSLGPNGDSSISVTLADPDVFDCPICFETLSVPVFQCENGHVSCSSCCIKIRNKCSSCSLPIGYNRCRAIEKVLESVKVSCRNLKYGCKETVSYSKKQDHDKACIYAPCSCPLPECNYVGSSRHLYRHVRSKHSNSAKRFCFDCPFHISIEMHQKYFILQEQNEGIIFIVNNSAQLLGNVVDVSFIGPSTSIAQFSYDLIARNGGCLVRLQSFAESIPRWAEHIPLKSFLLVPNGFIGSTRQLKLELTIQRLH